MTLTAARQGMATAIKPLVADDVSVSADIPDAVAPPAVYVAWGVPWLVPQTHCIGVAQLEVVLVANRIEAGGSYDKLEELVEAVLQVQGQDYQFVTATAPYPLQIGGNAYLAASVNFTTAIEGM